MSEHDAASVVGQMAGLTTDKPKPGPVTPEQLAARFCTQAAAAGLAHAHPFQPENGHQVARGFCGYLGVNARDYMVSGFDDGYEFMGFLGERGWNALPAKGDWPYIVYMAYAPREPYAIAEYIEADLTVWTFETGEAAQALYRTLRDCP